MSKSKIIDLEKQPDGTYSESTGRNRSDVSETRERKTRKNANPGLERQLSQRIPSDPIQTLLNAAVRQLERETKKLIRSIFR